MFLLAEVFTLLTRACVDCSSLRRYKLLREEPEEGFAAELFFSIRLEMRIEEAWRFNLSATSPPSANPVLPVDGKNRAELGPPYYYAANMVYVVRSRD